MKERKTHPAPTGHDTKKNRSDNYYPDGQCTNQLLLSSEKKAWALLMLEEIQNKVERMGSIALAAKLAEELSTIDPDFHSINLFGAIHELSESATAYHWLREMLESIPSQGGSPE